MAEVTGAYTFRSFSQAIALEVGWSLYDALTTDQQLQIKLVINRAVQEYYNSHEWAFLNKYATFATVANVQDYDCPDDFGNVLEGDAGIISFPASPNFWQPIQNVPEHRWRYLTQIGKNWGSIPSLYCVTPKTQAGATGQRFQIRMWPIPNQIWDPMTYQYRVLTNELTEESPYPLGGNTHGMAIMNLALAQACGSITRDLNRQQYYKNLFLPQLEQNKVNDGLNKSAVIGPGGGAGGGYGYGNMAGQVGLNGRFFGCGAGWPVPFTGTGSMV